MPEIVANTCRVVVYLFRVISFYYLFLFEKNTHVQQFVQSSLF